jgi:uncharacterized membrane protein YphA (DoxX/SURF4 family)
VIATLIGLMLAVSGSMKLMKPPEFIKQWVDTLGYPEDVAAAIGIVEICCAVLYLIPQTAVLGAVLLTGYLGGAVATHVRVHDNFLSPAIGGVLVWLSLFLRDPRVRALLPFRQSITPADPGT